MSYLEAVLEEYVRSSAAVTRTVAPTTTVAAISGPERRLVATAPNGAGADTGR